MSYFIGLLSGTSVDAIDAALVKIDANSIKLITSHGQPFSKSLRSDLQTIIKNQHLSLQSLSITDVQLAREFSLAVKNLLDKAKIRAEEIIAIGSHGQTLYHQPSGTHTNSLQIGSAHVLAAETGINVVSHFRNIDMAFAGQGAPLAPIIHQKLYAKEDTNTAVVNLGGIANISFIGKDYPLTIGFDLGPANCLLDEWTELHKGLPFDKDGNWARAGQLKSKLLQAMLKDDYFHKAFPKSTGREYFNLNWLKKFDLESIAAIDVQTTLTHLSARLIADALSNENYPFSKIILMGGGARNIYLKTLIQDYTQINICKVENSDWVEAILFAYLAYLRVNEVKITLSSITGSSKPMLLGDITQL